MFVLALLVALSVGFSAGFEEGEGLQGRVVVPGLARYRDFRLLVQLHAGEGQLSAFCKSDGTFTLPPMPPGVHLLTVTGAGEWTFPQVKIDVSSRAVGSIRVSTLETWKTLRVPLILKGSPMSHFDPRRPFNLWGILKSPYGIMICVMLFGIVVFPMMKLDPEEYRQAQEMWRGQPQDKTPQLTQPSRRKD